MTMKVTLSEFLGMQDWPNERLCAYIDDMNEGMRERDDLIRELEKLLPCASRAFRAEMERRIEELGIGEI